MSNSENKQHFSPDYIIVGAGAAGCVLAARLAEDKNNRVLLIEAGPDNTNEQNIQTAASWLMLSDLPKMISPTGSPSHLGFLTVPQNGKIYAYPRGLGLGGSSNHHAMIDGRGSLVIYDKWAELLDDPSWNGERLTHYFRKMENFDDPHVNTEAHGQDGWLHIKKSTLSEEFHHDLIAVVYEKFGAHFRDDFYDDPNDLSGIGCTDMQVHTDGRRSYAATDLLLKTYDENKSKGWNNLEILTNKLVTRVVFEGNRAVGVEFIDAAHAYKVDSQHIPENRNGAKRILKANKEVILCGGSINTPQLLLLSGIGPKQDLEKLGITVLKDAPGVGHNLQDHMELSLVYEMNNLPNKVWRGQAALLSLTDPSWSKYADLHCLTENGINLIWDWFSDYDARDKRDPDLHIHVVPNYFRDFNFNPEKFNDPDPLKAGYIQHTMSAFKPQDPKSYICFLTEIMHTDANTGSVQLASMDPTDAPILDLQLNQSDADVTRLALGLQLVRSVMNHPNLQPHGPDEILPGPAFSTLEDVKNYIKNYSSFGHHISGTAKMGKPSDPLAVVDSQLHVIGVDGLRVCDASIFPLIPGYNTSRPSYMVGEVLADKIKENG